MKDLRITDCRVEPGDSAFLIDDGETAILYDSGFGFTGFRVADKIREQLGDRDLDYIFLTHSHYDHALGSAYVLRSYPGAKVVAGSYAADVFTRDGAKRVMKELDNAFALTKGVTDYPFLGDELRVDIPCEDGDVIEAGKMKFKVINLPGHTKCSVGYYCEEKKLLLSVETLGVYTGRFDMESIMPAYLVGYQMALDSIDKALTLDIDYLLSPHLGILTEEQTKYFLSNMKKATISVTEEILAQLRDGLSDKDIVKNYKEKYWHGYNRLIYPEDAITLNTSIMIKIIRKELFERKE